MAPSALSSRLSMRKSRTIRPRAGTKRGAQRDLAPASGESRGQQIRDVAARDEKHERDRRQQREDCRPHVAGEVLANADRDLAQRRIRFLAVLVAISFGEDAQPPRAPVRS